MTPTGRSLGISLAMLLIAALPTVVDGRLWVLMPMLWVLLVIAFLVDYRALRRFPTAPTAAWPKELPVGAEVNVPLGFPGAQSLRWALLPEASGPIEATVEVKQDSGPGEATLRLQGLRRGPGQLLALWSRLDGPLGMLRRIDRHLVDHHLTVVPNASRVRQLTLAHYHAQGHGGQHRTLFRGDGGDFDALLRYEPGMDLRQVDWKVSARHQAPRVRSYRLEQNQGLVICIDQGRLMGDRIEGVQRIDHAIHAGLALAGVALRAGDRVGLHCYGDAPNVHVPLAAQNRQLGVLRQSLAGLQAFPEETNHVRGMLALLRQLRRRSLVVVFTDFSNATTAELLVESLRHVIRRHLVVFVALDDPRVEEPFRGTPQDPASLGESLVSVELKTDRRRIFRRLRRMGVEVISGAATPATLQLLARYVHLKRRGRLG